MLCTGNRVKHKTLRRICCSAGKPSEARRIGEASTRVCTAPIRRSVLVHSIEASATRHQSASGIVIACTTNHCALFHCSKAEETAPKIGHWCLVSTSQTVFFLMETSHRHVGDGSLHRKCFIVSVENLRCSIMKKQRGRAARKVEIGFRRGESETPIGRATAPRTFLESTPAILRVGFDLKVPTPVYPYQHLRHIDPPDLIATYRYTNTQTPVSRAHHYRPAWIPSPSTTTAMTKACLSRRRWRRRSQSQR
jgi:hypothetical protein